MKSIFLQSLKRIDYKLFGTLLIFGLLPTIYTTVRIFFLGNMPSDWGFNIASQLSWLNVIYEVIQEAIMLPIFYIMGKSLENKNELENKIRSGLIVTFFIYAVISLIIIIFTRPILEFMNQKQNLINETVKYIRIETVASIFSALVQFLVLIIITIKKEKYLLIILTTQMILTITFDTFLVSSLPISMNIGVCGIGYSNIIVNFIITLLIALLLRNQGIKIISFKKTYFGWMKEWFKVGSYSGIESFIRNTAFMLMVIRMVNVVGEQGTFWVANNFIWGWLLLPVLQFGQLVKRDCGEYGNEAIKKNTVGYFSLTGVIVIIWVLTIPLWQGFIKNVMNVENYQDIFNIAILSLPFYIIFAFNNVIDSIFYGIGKTDYMLFQSIVVNTLYYGTLFILYRAGIYKPTLNLIALMFAGGIAIDSLLTFGIFIWMLKKRKLTILREFN